VQAILKLLLEKFELFIKRSILPSSTLYILLLIVFYQKLPQLTLNLDNTLHIIIAIIVLIGTSYILKILHQAIFDNQIKSNYNSNLFYKDENNRLDELRKKATQKLYTIYPIFQDNLTASDFVLFQILGGILRDSQTQRYATDAKETGITFISFLIVLLVVSFTYCLLLLVVLPLIWYIGYELVKSKYRSRAFRLYVNFLLFSTDKPQEAKEHE